MLNALLALNELDAQVFDSPEPGAAPRVYDSHVVVPDAHLLFNGEFKRVGTGDLKIVGDDGQSFFIPDYFAAEKRASLMSPEGATLSASVVEALAGPLAPGQHAQAGGQAASAQPVIGRVDALTGSATVVRNGVSVALNIGDTVRKGDVVQTSGSSAVAIVFSDGTTFSLNANARMVLNDFVYNAGGAGNSAAISLVQGAFSFVAGQVAKTGDMRVETPVATMGIRGTAVLVEISASDGQTKFSVMVEPDGTTGAFNLYNKTTGALIGTVNNSAVGWVVSPAGPLQVVAQQQQKTPAELAQELGIVQQIFTIFNNNQQNPFVPTQDRGDNQNDNNPQTAGSSGSGDVLETSGNSFAELINTVSNNGSLPPISFNVPLPGLPPVDPTAPPIINITVSANQPPEAVDDLNGTPGDGGGDVIDNDTDPEGGIIVVQSAQHIDPVQNVPDGPLVQIDTDGEQIEGKYGTLTLRADGTYSYSLDPDRAAFRELAEGEAAVEKFQYTISDPFGATATAILTVNVTGTNDAPVIDLSPVITQVSVPDLLPAGADLDAEHAIAPAVSNDGRYVVFFSTPILPTDEDSDDLNGDVFLYDRLTTTTTTLTDGDHFQDILRPDGESYVGFSITGDGRYVVFEGEREVDDLYGTHTEGRVYVYDRVDDETRLLVNPVTQEPFSVDDLPRISSGGLIAFASQQYSENTGFSPQHILVTNVGGHILTDITADSLGISAQNAWLGNVDISGNGRYLTFWSEPHTLNQSGPSEPDGPATLYSFDRVTSFLIEIATTNTSVDDDTWWAPMSDDGSVVVFQSNLQLVADDTNNASDIYLWDRVSNSIELITLPEDAAADGGSIRPSISSDGRYITFASEATNLVAGDTNGLPDTFIYDRQTQTFQRVSVAGDGTQGDGDSSLASDVSGNGNIVVFSGTASNLVPGDNNDASDVFVVDRSGGTVGVVVEDASVTVGNTINTLNTYGAFAFSDADLFDTHSVQVTGVQISGAPAGFTVPSGGLGTFNASVVETSSDSDPSGQIAWTFDVDNALVQGLGAGQRITQTYTIEIADPNGGTVSQDVRVTITGRNDAPAVVSATATGSVSAGTNTISEVGASYLVAGHDLINGLGGTSGFGEFTFAANDDSSTGVIITSVFETGLNFFRSDGEPYFSSIYINNNGNITFSGPLSTFTPSQIGPTVSTDNPIIAPFWADVDTRGSGATTTPGGNSTGTNLVYYDLDAENGVVTITWDDVGYYDSHINPLNAFQLQLIDRGDGDFDIVFRYEDIGWTTGDVSVGFPARAGYSADDGDPNHYFELAGSGNQNSMLALEDTAGNTGIDGVYVFEVRAGEVGNPTSTGTIEFSDADVGDTHTVSANFNADASSGGTALGALNVSLTRDTATGANGLVTWNYVANSDAVSNLPPGTGQTEVYDVVISDGNGGTVTQQVTISVNGPADEAVVLTVQTDEGFDTTSIFEPLLFADLISYSDDHVSLAADDLLFEITGENLSFVPYGEDQRLSGGTITGLSVLRPGGEASELLATFSGFNIDGLEIQQAINVFDDTEDTSNFVNIFRSHAYLATGGDGADVLAGGFGNDTLTGGADADSFLFDINFGSDVILDFVSGEDTIDVSPELTAVIDPQMPSLGEIADEAFAELFETGATRGSLQFRIEGQDAVIQVGTDSLRIANVFDGIQLHLSASDFVLQQGNIGV